MTTVIKVGQSDVRLLRRLESVDLADHLVEASKIVNAARRDAARMTEQAKAAAIQIRQEADQRGFAEAYAKGLVEGRKTGHEQAFREAADRFRREQADLCKALSAAVAELERGKRDILIEAGQDMLRFAVRLAEKVTRRAVAVDSSAAVANLREVLRLVGTRTDMTVRIHPADAETLRLFAKGLAEDVANQAHVRFVEDASISPGGCRVRTETTEIDATVETQIGQIVGLILGRPADQGQTSV